MRNLNTLLWVVFTCIPFLAFAQTWNGSVDSDWNKPANWTPATVPNSTAAFALIFSGSPNLPVTLSSDVQVGILLMETGTSLDLGGRKIEIHSSAAFSGNVLSNGRIEQRGAGVVTFASSTFTGIAIEKHGSGSILGNGGNTFNGTTVFEAKPSVTGLFQVGNSLLAGDSYTGLLEIRNQANAVNLTVGAFGTHTLSAGVKLFNTANGSITLGGSMGSVAVSGAIDGTGNTAGNVNLTSVTQSGGTANNLGTPANLALNSSRFSGDFSCTAGTSLTVTGSMLNGTGINTLASPSIIDIQGSAIGGPGSTNLVHKLSPSGVANTWSGNNTFRNITVRNSSNSGLTLAGSTGDTYLGDARFENLGNGLMRIALFGTNTFSADLVLQNSSNQGIQVGATSAPHFTTIAGNLKNAGFANGPLELRRLEQQASTPNDAFSPTAFRASSATVRGDFSCTPVGNITALENSTFSRSNSFTASRIVNVTGCTFSDLGGMTTLTKTGATADNWSGNNTFHTVEIINNSGAALRLANTSAGPDYFLKKATFRRLSGGQLIPCNTSDCYFRDTISTLGTSSSIAFGGTSTGDVIIDGDKTQVLLGGATFRRLVMNTTGKLQLQSELTILNSSTFSNGIIESSASHLFVYESSASLPSGSNTSHVDGPVRRSGSGNFRFPVGNNGKYAFVEISGTAASNVFTVQYFNTAYVSTTVDATLDHVSECEYWQIDCTGSMSPATLTFSWDNVRSCGVDNLSDLKIARWNATAWTNLGGIAVGGPASGTIALLNIDTFGTFTLASLTAANPLPIELIHFTARPNGKAVDLTWATATEKDNDYFTVERSRDGTRFDPLLRVPGAGNSTETLYYYEVDERPLPGVSYYRLKQTDYDGTFSYSNVVAVRMPVDDKAFAVFPNPADDYFLLETGPDPAQLRYRLLNSMGQTVPVAPAVEAGRLRFSTHGLVPGLYFLEVQYQNSTQSLKVVLR